MKNSYALQDEVIIYRRANDKDNFDEIAELIYESNPYIYPYWFSNNVEECKKFFNKKIVDKGFFFHYDNIYVAYDALESKIVGILVAIDKSVGLNYDYNDIVNVNQKYRFVVNSYLKEIIADLENFSTGAMYISNLCIDKKYRDKHIGTRLVGYFIAQMEKAGFNSFHVDCPIHNLRAKNLYHTLNFKEVAEMSFFDGTNKSNAGTVTMLRKKNEYMKKDFVEALKRAKAKDSE